MVLYWEVSKDLIFESKRSESDIIHKILSETKKGIKKTHLMYKANLSNKQLNRYLNILVEKRFVEKKGTLHNGKQYFLTNKGIRLLNPLTIFIKLIAGN